VVSYDPTKGKAWIADSSRVVVIDTSGRVQATITGFKFANSLSAASGVCWVSDAMGGKVYKFEIADVSGRVSASTGLVYDDLIAPWSVSTSAVDGSVWIADKEAGRVVRLDENGNEIATGSGLTLPTLIRVHQVIE
jgi:sugar lactone lactonase YvrE